MTEIKNNYHSLTHRHKFVNAVADQLKSIYDSFTRTPLFNLKQDDWLVYESPILRERQIHPTSKNNSSYPMRGVVFCDSNSTIVFDALAQPRENSGTHDNLQSALQVYGAHTSHNLALLTPEVNYSNITSIVGSFALSAKKPRIIVSNSFSIPMLSLELFLEQILGDLEKELPGFGEALSHDAYEIRPRDEPAFDTMRLFPVMAKFHSRLSTYHGQHETWIKYDATPVTTIKYSFQHTSSKKQEKLANLLAHFAVRSSAFGGWQLEFESNKVTRILNNEFAPKKEFSVELTRKEIKVSYETRMPHDYAQGFLLAAKILTQKPECALIPFKSRLGCSIKSTGQITQYLTAPSVTYSKSQTATATTSVESPVQTQASPESPLILTESLDVQLRNAISANRLRKQ